MHAYLYFIVFCFVLKGKGSLFHVCSASLSTSKHLGHTQLLPPQQKLKKKLLGTKKYTKVALTCLVLELVRLTRVKEAYSTMSFPPPPKGLPTNPCFICSFLSSVPCFYSYPGDKRFVRVSSPERRCIRTD